MANNIEITVPQFPESVTEGTLVTWYKKPGEAVKRDEKLLDIETDKVVLEVPSPADGVLTDHLKPEGAAVTSKEVVGYLSAGTGAVTQKVEQKEEPKPKKEASKPKEDSDVKAGPAARKWMEEHQVAREAVEATGRGGRITKADVLQTLEKSKEAAPMVEPPKASGRKEERVRMTRLRERIAERLVEAQRTAAILTTFNEVNLKAIIDIRQHHKEAFEKAHGVRLGFMSFFVKAAVEALKSYPIINASVDGQDIVYHGFYDIGVAVSSPRGLVVPVLRDVDQMTLADIEKGIADYAQKAKDGKLSLEDLTGGTFTISNGGVFGSLLSTPILNPPQSAILGMHKTQDRPIAEDGQIVIRPMMYLAMSYDHRIIDGRDAVQFLVSIKSSLEDPARILLEL